MTRIDGKPAVELRVAILLLPQFTLSAFSLFLDPVRLAADEHDGSRQIRCNWRVMTLNNRPVQSSCGVEVYPTGSRFDYAEIDWLVVVGGLIRTANHDDDRVLDVIRTAASAGVRVVGLCTGVFSMAAAGILDDEVCCVSWFHREEFVAKYDARVVDSSRLFQFGKRHATCAGGIGAAHVALEIIRRRLGDEVATKSARILLMPQYWTHNAEQPMARSVAVHSTKVRDALRYMEARIDEPVAMPDVARSIGLSVRQLERLFNVHVGHSPRNAMTRLRLEKACVYLAETDSSIIEIAMSCGYMSPSHFTCVFKSEFGVPPSAYRQLPRGNVKA